MGRLVDNLRRARAVEAILLCTSYLESDDELETFCGREGLPCFRGHPDDVLSRIDEAAKSFQVNLVVSCTADNPLTDPEWIDRLVTFHREKQLDFSRTQGLPFGCFAYAVTSEALRRACALKQETDSEVWGGYFTETGLFRCDVLEVEDPAVRWPELRLTVDTPEDFALLDSLYQALPDGFSLADVVAHCRAHPDLVALNSTVAQKLAKPIRWSLSRV